MTTAAAAAEQVYVDGYYITDHAVEQYRLRGGEDTKYRLDDAVERELRRRITESIQRYVVIDRDYPDRDTWIYVIRGSTGIECHVLLRQRHPGSTDLTAITVLTGQMATNYLNSGRWKIPDRPRHPEKVLVSSRPIPLRPVEPAPPPPEPTVERRGGTRPLGATRAARREWVLEYMRANPRATNDELSDATRDHFGTGLSDTLIAELRAVVRGAAGAAPEPTTTGEAKARAQSVKSKVKDIAIALAQAVSDERAARDAVDNARAALEAAEAALAEASTRAEDLLKHITGMRG